MQKGILYMVLLAVLFVSCEEYYTPDLEVVPGMLVVESHLTNDPTQNFVKLSLTHSFYSSSQMEKATGAKVELIQVGNETTRGTEINSGYFTFSHTPVFGEKYILRITYQNALFESDVVEMPPIPTIDTLYTKHHIDKTYRTNSLGIPALKETPGREILINAPILPELEYYRFNWRAVIQWEYQPPIIPGQPPVLPPPIYGWTSKYSGGQFNLAGQKDFSISDKVSNHPILWLNYNSSVYLDSTNLIPWEWILIVEQYGISKASHEFYKKLNKQFSADGSLFDPVLTQVNGNIHCKTKPEKAVLGLFDLKSYNQHRFYLSLGTGDDKTVIQRRIHEHFDIPPHGWTDNGARPIFWEFKTK
jgi:hypothetical protein